MDTNPEPPPVPPAGATDSEAKAPPEIEAMAEKAVADLEAGEGGEAEPMETEPTTNEDRAAPANQTDNSTFETPRPSVVAQTESSLTVSNENQGQVTIARVPPPLGTATELPEEEPIKMEPTTPAAPAAASGGDSDTDTPGTDKSKRDKKRKTSRTVRRVLIAKKEHEAATQAMTGLRDISQVLDPDDALFLGEKYWVFTQQQLAWLIRSVSPPLEGKEDPSTKMEVDGGENAQEKMETEEGSWKDNRDMLLANMAARLKFDSDKTVNTEVETDESGVSKQISIASREDAEKRLQEWEEKLKSIEGRPFLVEEEGFSLDGPLKFLLPKGFKNFLDSIEIKTVFQFLALKKTETGALCELYALWRHTCSLARVTSPAVVRYFLGIHARMEGALTALPPCDEKKRKWMNNTIVVMTGAALEFLVEDRGIYTARAFVDARTKDLSLQLAQWRERKNLEPLKGSGKVAMISGWKAVAKEIIVIESGDGQVVPNLRQMASNDLCLEDEPSRKRVRTPQVKQETTTPVQKKAPPKTPASRTPAARTPATPVVSSTAESARKPPKASKSEYDLHSKLFLEQILGVDVTEFLALASIHTAAQLFDTETNDDETLLNAMVEAEEAKDLETAANTLKAWTTKLRDNLSGPAPKSKRKGRPQGKAIKPEILRGASDPYDLMSDVTKTFLATMDIHTAEQFLSTRTTEIAAEFVKFRKKNGMPELKGLGSIASVSGWKANCRRFARAMGREDIAVLEPAETTTATPRSAPMKAAIVQQLETPVATGTMTHEDVLFGKSRRMFAVQGESDIPIQFRFDVSLRNNESGPGIGMYLTYKGSGPSIRPASVLRVPLAGSSESETVALLTDTTLTKSGDSEVDARAPFAYSKTGCGLIDLQKYGVRPLKDQDLDGFKKALQNFFVGFEEEKPLAPEDVQKFNIGIRRSDIDKCQYLAVVGSPLQSGQTMALVFPTIDTFLASPLAAESGEFEDRNVLLSSLFLASKNDLRAIIEFLTAEIVPNLSLEEKDPMQLTIALKALQRVDFLSRRILAQLSNHNASKDEKLTLSFTQLKEHETFTSLSDEVFDEVVEGMKEELKTSFLSLIEHDCILGKSERDFWCPFAKEIYDEVVSIVLSATITKRTETFPDVKERLDVAFKRANELSVDSSIIPKLAFSKSPFGDTDAPGGKVVVCPSKEAKVEDEDAKIADTDEKKYAAIPLEDVEQPGKPFYSTSPDVTFYRTYLARIAVKTVTVFGKIIDSSDFDADAIIDSWKLGEVMSPESRASIVGPWNKPVEMPTDPLANLQPPTEQFFLGIVWPVLREFGWRIELEEFPNKRAFVAPRWKGDQQKLGKLAKLAKTHRDRRRQNLAREVNQIGFGALTKLTKRLFVASGGLTKEGDALAKPALGRKVLTVNKICDKFIEHLESTAELDGEVLERVKDIVDQVVECFDSLAPSIQRDTGDRPSEKFGADVFMQFLLVLPALLGRSEVGLQEMNDSLELVHELTAFMSFKHMDVFPGALRPSQEVYMTKGKEVPSSLLQRLKKPSGDRANAPDELTEVLWEDDMGELSDFVVNVMSQTVACRATQADVARKFRRIHVGYPGVVCRHCMGEGGEGRYFFTTIESLTTLGTVFEKHIMKCAYVPAEVRKSVVSARATHAEQRKTFPNGAQQAYFNRLWDRLRSMKIAGSTSSSAVPLAMTNGTGTVPTEEVPGADLTSTGMEEKLSFTDFMEILDFVRTVPPWKGTREIEEALNQYYNCLDYGGRIYQTKSMPDHFSAAWLLNKVVPRRSRTAIKRHLPG